MSTWRNLMTPQISKYMDSQNKNNSHLNFAETPVNMLSTLNSKEYPEILSTNRIETSEFGDGDIKRIKYQEKLNKIQREILELKKQTTISRNNELFSSQTNIISNKENYFSSSKDDLQQKDFDEKSFLKKTNGQMNFIYTNNIKENQTNKKSRKNSFYERKKISTNRKKNPSYLSIKDFNLSTEEIKNCKNLNLQFRDIEEEPNSLSKDIRTQSLDHLDYGINLTIIVRNLQQKLKKEINLRLEMNKKLKQSKKEIFNMKSYITKLEKDLYQIKKEIHNPIYNTNIDRKDVKLFELSNIKNEIINKIENSSKNHDDKINQECEETIKDLMITKTGLLDALENILQICTSQKETDNNLLISQSQIGNSLQKFKQCKKKFNNKKKLLAKAAHNYDLPLQSNENSKSSSLKDEFGKSKINLSKKDLQEIYSSNFKMETTNNLNYTPSNFESISFLESKNTKPS